MACNEQPEGPTVFAASALRGLRRNPRLFPFLSGLFCAFVFLITALPLPAQAQREKPRVVSFSSLIPTNAPPVTNSDVQPIAQPIVRPAVRPQKPRRLTGYEKEVIKRAAQENTERFRQQFALPAGATENLPEEQVAGQDGQGGAGAAAEAQNPLVGIVTTLLVIFLAAAGWYIAARKYAPEMAASITNVLVPRALRPAMPADAFVTLMAEEQAVADFQTSLNAGARRTESLGEAKLAPAENVIEIPLPETAEYVAEMRRLVEKATRAPAGAAQRRFLVEACSQAKTLKELAGAIEMTPLRQMTSAIEMLLKQLTEKTSNITSSTLRTVSVGVTMLEDLSKPGLNPNLLSEPPMRLLAVDDETFSRFALAHALKRGLTDPDVADSGESALALANRNTYDLILLDVQMPGMDGFELCSKIHETATNRTTPVIFVTSLRDFDARANSLLCGGRDLIAKPFLTFEIVVKSLTLVAGERLRGRGVLADAPQGEVKPEKPVETTVASATPAVEKAATETAKRADTEHVVKTPAGSRSSRRSAIGVRSQIAQVREMLDLVRATPDPLVRQKMLQDLIKKIQLLASGADRVGQRSVAALASALEVLLKRLAKNGADLPVSVLETAASSAALMQEINQDKTGSDMSLASPIRALVVDDDPVSLRAVSNALQMKFSKPEGVMDGKSALALAAEKPFDIIFLDVQMPQIDGFQVCAGIRETSANRHTPVVFLTGTDGPELRKKAKASGSNEFLTKQSMGSELTLKALDFALRGRLKNAGKNGAKATRQ